MAGIEWGIAHRATPDRLHRGPFTLIEALEWLREWEQESGNIELPEFLLVRREVGDWTLATAPLERS